MSSTIIHRGRVIEIVPGGFRIKGHREVYADLDMAKRMIQMGEFPRPENPGPIRTITSFELMSVSLNADGTYGMCVNKIKY